MALPVGVTTATVEFGKDGDALGVSAAVALSVTPSHTIIWAATGEPIRAFVVDVEAAAGVHGSFEIPHTDQPGFVDELGRAITNWWYDIGGLVKRGAETEKYRKKLQVATGQSLIDLDLVPINGKVGPVGSTVLPSVLAVNGKTGAVEITPDDIDAIPAAQKGAALGVAELDDESLVPLEQIPVQAIADDPLVRAQIGSVAGLLTKAGEAYVAERYSQPPVYDRPVITSAATSQISGGTVIAPVADYFGDANFRYNGCASVQATAFGVLSAEGTPWPEHVTDAQSIEFKFRDGRTGDIGIRVLVNGRMAQVRALRVAGTSGDTRYVRLQFPDARVRHIQFEHDGFNAFGGVVVGASTVHRRPTREWRARWVGIGDSLLQGQSIYDYLRLESFDRFLAYLLGMDFYMNLGVGGSGFVNPAGAANPFSARVPLALSVNPHVIGFSGSRNDQGSIAAECQAVIDTLGLAADVPAVYVIGAAQAGFDALSEQIRQGAIAAGRTYLDINGLAQSPGTAPQGHPTFDEMLMLASAAYGQIDRQVVDARVEGVNTAKSGPTVALTTSAASPAVGTSVTLTATLSGSYAGSVRFYDGTTLLGTSTVAGGVATHSTSALAVSAHAISARFVPANPFAVRSATSNTITVTVTANLGFSDDFNRADGALGSTLNGKAWTIVGGWAIASNKCKSPTSGFAYVDAGTPNVDISWTVSGTVPNAANPVIRYLDGGNYLHLNGNGLYEIVASGASTLLVAFTPTGIGAGDVIRVTCVGDVITVRKGSTVIGTHTTTRFNTATRFGMRGGAAATDTYYDDVTCVAA